HSFDEGMLVQAATCLTDGMIEKTCTACGATRIEKIPATGHSHQAVVTAPTCTDSGFTTYTCHCGDSYVGDYLPATGHAFGEWTQTAPGVEERSCETCGETETREKEPVYDADGNGAVDQADLTLLMSVLVGNAEAEVLYDFDFDGKLTVYDCVLLMQQIS
ncbi:MAG: dockerin type I repeat-containing protein, partial [Clostridia bacterium]|nr:dockerin type I repeat-containing protein [Clostridia bacterium]